MGSRAHALLLCAAGALVSTAAVSATPMVSFGYDHALALASDGRVYAWGSDQFGKLGTNRLVTSTVPIVVQGLSNVRSVAGGLGHSLAVKQDGSVWAWGRNDYGQLGEGGFSDHAVPIPVVGLTGIQSACAGDAHSAAVRNDGTVWAWGTNLGNGTRNNSPVPLQVAGLTGVTAVACGAQLTMALRSDGTVWIWGSNDQGGLGTGAALGIYQVTPVQIPSLANVISIAAGQWVGAAVKQDGSVWEWGYVFSTGAVRSTPVPSPGITGALKVSATVFSLRVVAADRTRWWAWDGGATPQQQSAVGNLEALAPGFSHTLILRSDRSVLAYGTNDSGQLGDGTTTFRGTPVGIPGLNNVVSIAAGYYHSLAVDGSGQVWAWGSDSNGQLGRGQSVSHSVPVLIPGLADIVQVSAGSDHSAAVDRFGNVWMWGGNSSGELGTGNLTSSSSPIRLASLGNIAAVSAGGYFTIALGNDGTVWTWGANDSGQIGDGTSNLRMTPYRVGIDNVGAVAAGAHALALRRDGTVWAWGRNQFGQLGLGSITPLCCASPPPNSRPVQVPGISGITAVAATNYNSYALKSDGTVLAWGDNAEGTLGDGTTTLRSTPGAVPGLTNVTQISAGIFPVLARRSDGSVWGWGQDTAGELGAATPRRIRSPTALAGVAGIQQVAAGRFVSALLSQDGWIYTRGHNETGQLGDGTFARHGNFVLVVNTSADGFLNLAGSSTTPPSSAGVAFFVNSTGVITDTRATVKALVKFRSQDVGHPIFIFGYAPSSLVKSATKAAAGGATSPNDDAPCVRVQVDNRGQPRQVSASGMQPSVNNVTSSRDQTVDVLDNVLTEPIAGTTMCVGAGASGDQAADPANNRCVASIPGDQVCVPPEGSSSTPPVPPDLPGALSGLWWNSTESGWGIHFTQRRNIVFAAWYTYDGNGNPKWYVASNCTMPAANVTSGTCNGALYEVDGPTFFGTPFNPSAVHVTQSGSLSVTFANADNASMTYTVGTNSRTVAITRQPITSGTTQPAINYTDLWWNPNENGWGIAIAQQYGIMFLAWYVYDGTGKPMWYVASNCTVSGNGCSGTLYRTTGPPFGPTFNPGMIQVFTAGTVSLNFTDSNNGTLSYTVNGVAASKAITRQLF